MLVSILSVYVDYAKRHATVRGEGFPGNSRDWLDTLDVSSD